MSWPRIKFVDLDETMLKNFIDNFEEWAKGFEKIKDMVPEDMVIHLKKEVRSGVADGISLGRHGGYEHWIELNFGDISKFPEIAPSIIVHEAIENSIWAKLEKFYPDRTYGEQEAIVESITRKLMGAGEYKLSNLSPLTKETFVLVESFNDLKNIDIDVLAKNLAILKEIDTSMYNSFKTQLLNSGHWFEIVDMVEDYNQVFNKDWAFLLEGTL